METILCEKWQAKSMVCENPSSVTSPTSKTSPDQMSPGWLPFSVIWYLERAVVGTNDDSSSQDDVTPVRHCVCEAQTFLVADAIATLFVAEAT